MYYTPLPPSIGGGRLPPLLLLTAITLLSVPHRAHGYSWSFGSTPTQCGNLSVVIGDAGGTPPFRVLIVPFGPSPLKNNVEVRQILDVPFSESQRSVQFALPYPEGSQFVAVVSDANGFNSGGTSAAITVGDPGSNSSCFDVNTSISLDFFFNIAPENQVVECQDMRIWWDPATVKGTPMFLGVIPGGQSFVVPGTQITNTTELGTGFTWKPSLRAGTTLLLVGGDDRGNGTSGRIQNVVSLGTSGVPSTCLSENSPSSTAGTPAGGSLPTATKDGSLADSKPSENGTRRNIAVIVGSIGAVIAAVVIVSVLLLLRRRRQRRDKDRQRGSFTNVANKDHDDSEEPHDEDVPGDALSWNERPENFQPRPLVLEHLLPYGDRYSDSGSSKARRNVSSSPPPEINYVQHQDAGPSTSTHVSETIELPPSYDTLRGSTLSEESSRITPTSTRKG